MFVGCRVLGKGFSEVGVTFLDLLVFFMISLCWLNLGYVCWGLGGSGGVLGNVVV